MNKVDVAVYSKLAADTTLTGLMGGTYIYNGLAPATATRPYIIFQKATGGPENQTPRDRRTYNYMVKCVSGDLMTGSANLVAGSIDAQIETAMHEQTLTVTGYDNYLCWRVKPDIDYLETAGGKVIRHLGGMYRIEIAP